MSRRPAAFSFAWLGRVRYQLAWDLQEALRRRILEDGGGDTLLLLEHEPVITLGRHADPRNILWPRADLAGRGVEVVATSRGGDVTYHGPGQLVGYPVFRLRRGLRHHVETLGAALVAVCTELGIAAAWRSDPAGVWVGEDKVAAFGLHVHKEVAIHGFALNVTTPLCAFQGIVPCGLRLAGVTSLAVLTKGQCPPPEGLAPRVAAAVGEAFGRAVMEARAADLWRLLSGSTPIQ
jgi:lipoyl(octanoyl) transferase